MFPHPRRIVTGHSPQGAAIVVDDDVIPCLPTSIKCNFAVLYETHQFPASNDGWVDPAKARTTDLSNQTGTVLRVVDFPPNTETVSLFTEDLGLMRYWADEFLLFSCSIGRNLWIMGSCIAVRSPGMSKHFHSRRIQFSKPIPPKVTSMKELGWT